MNKLVIGLIMLSLVLVSCATQVEETRTESVVQPNVRPVESRPIERLPEPMPAPAPAPTPTPSPVPAPVWDNPVTPAPTPQPVQPVQPAQPSEPDWANQTIQATGQCAVNTQAAQNPGQAKLMAKRGAIVEGQRNLMEQVLGVRLDSSTTVKDMVAQSDEVRTNVEGHIRGAQVISENFDGSVYTVVLGLRLYTVYTYLKENKIYYK